MVIIKPSTKVNYIKQRASAN